MIYLDNSATTRPCEQAVQAVTQSLTEGYFNPSALYTPAMQAEKELVRARRVVAQAVQASEKNVIFTSGGTESDNLAIWGLLEALHAPGRVLYSAAEHAGVKNACLAAEKRFGCKAEQIPLLRNGSVDLQALEMMLDDDVALICVMHVCNETGVIMPLDEICALRDRLAPKAAIHVDGVQSFLRVPFSMRKTGVQSYAISGHKIHATKGVGALVLRDGVRIREQMAGGGQQNGLRSGTENTCGIAGLAAAIEAYPADAVTRMLALKQSLVAMLCAALSETTVVGLPVDDSMSAGHILSVAFPPVRAETLLHALEADDIYVGTGSACSSKKGKHSAVLTAMKCSNDIMDGAIRISLCPYNTMDEMKQVAEKIIEKVTMLRRFTRR